MLRRQRALSLFHARSSSPCRACRSVGHGNSLTRVPVPRDGRTVATVSKQWFTFRDTYGVEIEDGEDAVLILASAVVVDMACHEDEKKD